MAAGGSDPPPATGPLDRRIVLLLAVACGACVANLYYAQPLLSTIGRSLGVSEGAAGILVTASQVGYALGLVLLVPLGDLLERRRLTSRALLVCAGALVVAALAPSLAVLALALAVAGVTSTVAQILVPFASALAGEDERGRVVGRVMSGLLIGILLGRTVAGLLAETGSWRLPFAVAAGLMVVLAAVLSRALPAVAPPSSLPYRRLLASVAELVRQEPALRRRMLYGACGFAEFSVLWTSIAFLLAGDPFHYGDGTIGLLALAGVLGAVAAQRAGVLADRGHGLVGTGTSLVLMLAGWGLLALGTRSILAVIAGLIVLDLGQQGQHILNQSTLYALRPEARSRLTTAYMTGNFAAGAAGSLAASVAWAAGGWGLVCAVGAAIALVSVLAWLTEALSRSSKSSESPPPMVQP